MRNINKKGERLNIYIATDHAGFEIKDFVKEEVKKYGGNIIDLGSDSNDRVDYPDYAHKLCELVVQDSDSQGILICGTGIGMSIAANKHKGIRAALCTDAYMAQMTKAHNDANVLCLGQRVVGLGVIESILRAWFTTSFEGGRHSCRIGKLEI